VDQTGKSALIHAVSRAGDDSMYFLELLIAAGANLDIRDDAHGWTALHWAMKKVLSLASRSCITIHVLALLSYLSAH
jgi:ankyrin repeat protein